MTVRRPITEPMYYCLLALHEQRHGYDIIRRVREISEGRVLIAPGTLYPLLKRMAQAGQIERVGDGRRKVYRLTPRGKDALFYEYKRIADMALQGAPVIFMMREREEDLPEKDQSLNT